MSRSHKLSIVSICNVVRNNLKNNKTMAEIQRNSTDLSGEYFVAAQRIFAK